MKILVIGELCVDRFVYGSIDRLCPEAPVPVINPIEVKENDGMAGNVVKNIESVYPNCDIIHWHQQNKLSKTRYVEKKSNQMVLRVDEGEGDSMESFGFISPQRNNTISESDVVIISDYNKNYLTNNDIVQISKISKFTIIDTKRKLTQEIVDNVDFVKVNQKEYLNNKEIADKNRDKFIITMGIDGVQYMSVTYPSPNPQETIDVSGAGDTFVASFTVKYLLTKDIVSSIDYANSVCANVVNKKGVSLPDKEFML